MKWKSTQQKNVFPLGRPWESSKFKKIIGTSSPCFVTRNPRTQPQPIADCPDPGLFSATQPAHAIHSSGSMDSITFFKEVQSLTVLEHFPMSP